jgi:uncharacterized protein (DUF1684 family)
MIKADVLRHPQFTVCIIFVLLVMVSTAVSAQPLRSGFHKKEIKQFQKSLNKEFADPTASPLTKEDQQQFRGLRFFPADAAFQVIAEFRLTPDEQPFEMPTTTDRKPMYRKFGVATFMLNNRACTLSVYQNIDLARNEEYADYLFLPFHDHTNGNTTYGGGRYLDLKIPQGNALIIDFNKAYNPYCAYNKKYSCPVPPVENSLDLEVKAGVKAYDNHSH